MQQLDPIQVGWTAFDQSGESLGEVQDVGLNYVLITKGMWLPRDLYVPADAVTRIDREQSRVHLAADKSSIDDMGWDEPPTDVPDASPGFTYGMENGEILKPPGDTDGAGARH